MNSLPFDAPNRKGADVISANNFHRQWEDIREDALAVFEHTAASGWYILGEEVEEFQRALAHCWGFAHAVGVASGMDAVEIGLGVLGCKPGDLVLTTPLSAFATTAAIVKLGAVPVFVDTDEYGLIDFDLSREALSQHPEMRFFLPVHLYGHALDLGKLRSLRDEFDLKIVEDCAQSIGAHFRGEPTGRAGQIAATSFYPTKNLGAMGDGGALLSDDSALATHAASLRDYGQVSKYCHRFAGYNSRLDELQAALLHRVMLPRLKGWLERRREIAERYLEGIRHPEVHCLGAPEGSESSWHLFPVLTQNIRKLSLTAHLRQCGVGTGEHYPFLIPDQPALAEVEFKTVGVLSNARRLATGEVSLPIHPYLTDGEVEAVIAAVNAWV